MVVHSVRELKELSVGTHPEFSQRRTRTKLQEKCSSVHKDIRRKQHMVVQSVRELEKLSMGTQAEFP